MLSVSSASADWELKKDKDGIQVFTREVADSRYREFKGTIVINSTLASVLGVLDHTESCPNWLHRCIEGKLIEQTSFNQRIIYQATDLPFPAASRDSVFVARTTYDAKSNQVQIHLQSAPGKHPLTNHVRIIKSSGSYTLEQLADDRVRVIWRQHIDPAGRLPSFVVNALVTDIPFESLANLRELVKKPIYQRLTFIYDDTGQVVSLDGTSW